ncbi:MAG: glucose-6-phosphate dehydrogenase [Acidobacteria bacterium]|nr:glucose-6-phosphate dehydrogenase [Acidobacteriota bacterium]
MSADQPTTAPDATVVIFGATGDLAKRKLLPALHNLACRGVLPQRFRVLGIGRSPMSDAEYRAKVKADVGAFGNPGAPSEVWAWFESRLFYASGTLDDLASYESIRDRLDALDGAPDAAVGYVFYLATPPDAVSDIVLRLGAVGLLNEEAHRFRRVIIEKPFGHDLSSAIDLDRQLNADLAEHQIYRIDHYLGKETVQNLMAFRFGNEIFEPIWNRRYIDHVQILVAETVGVEDRGAYYEQAGALRDMVQNHLFQLLALTEMEPPISFGADVVRDERVKALHAIAPWTESDVRANVVRGQYGSGRLGEDAVPGYRAESRVPPGSTTETYVALRLVIDNWRWAGVPFYLRTGKRLPSRVSEIAVQFNRPPLELFRRTTGSIEPNLLVVRIQPDEGISLRFQAKVPGPDLRLGSVSMAFNYADYFARAPETGYETLLLDCLTGDQTLFHRADMVVAGWRAVAPILELVSSQPDALLSSYAAGDWGPAEADALMARDGRAWRRPAP